jgi:CheY-like chemotaxis protein
VSIVGKQLSTKKMGCGQPPRRATIKALILANSVTDSGSFYRFFIMKPSTIVLAGSNLESLERLCRSQLPDKGSVYQSSTAQVLLGHLYKDSCDILIIKSSALADDGCVYADLLAELIGSSQVKLIVVKDCEKKGTALLCERLSICAYVKEPLLPEEFNLLLRRIDAPSGESALPLTRLSLGLLRQKEIKVLLAEDDPVSRILMTELLSGLKISVTAVEDGQRALEVCSQHMYDLVILDVEMPVMNGYEACTSIRRLPDVKWRNVPIIGLSGGILPEDRMRCLDSGMDDYIGKPASLDQLLIALECYLSVG